MSDTDSSGIVGTSAVKCAEGFRNHLANLFAALLPAKHVFGMVKASPRFVLGFVQGDNMTDVHLRGGARACSLFVMFKVKAVGRKMTFRLETEGYTYKILRPGSGDALIRWEYDRVPAEGFRSPRHHVQAIATVTDGVGLDVDLNRRHCPTGWVTIEEVLRFVFADLHVPCRLSADEWNQKLNESEKKFYGSFTSRRFHPHP